MATEAVVVKNMEPGLTPVPTETAVIPVTKKQLLILIAALILFLLSALLGFSSGSANARAEADYQNVDNLSTALKYFHSDNDSYPSADQFYNQQILVPMYLNRMPSVVGSAGFCQGYNQYYYSQTAPGNFTLKFCLTKAVSGLSAGQHQLTESGLQ